MRLSDTLRAMFERAGWKRRREDRRRSRDPDEALDEEPDWDDSNVLRFYGGGEAGGIGPELMSPRLLALLREYTAPGSREVGVLIDSETAEVLQMVKGRQTSLSFDGRILNSVADVASIHTHNEDVAFSDVDWDAFVASNMASVEMVVSPLAVYVLHKGTAYNPVPAALGQEDVGDHWRRRLREVLEELALVARRRTQPELDREAIAVVNQGMAELFGVEMKRLEF